LAPHDESQSDLAMGLLKSDVTRFFALGFGAGALLVLATIGIGSSGDVANGVVPQAVAAEAN
jgi:mannose/fructose/N-acetylgalactosamine-specific phosphotransferase system component IIC